MLNSLYVGGGGTKKLASSRKFDKFVKKKYSLNIMNYIFCRKLGFTLSEVLITLAIIGIVAALTIPNLVHNFQIKTLRTQFKEAQSIITQAVGMMKANESLPSLYNYYTAYDSENGYYRTDEFAEDIKQYVKIQKEFNDTKTEVPDYYTYDGSRLFSSSDISQYVEFKPSLILANGAYFRAYPAGSLDGISLFFLIDINGAKGPNKLGHDLFQFVIKNSNDIVDGRKMTKLYTDEDLEDQDYQGMLGIPCSIKSKQSSNGIGCTWYAMHDICPDDETKGYWECLPK